MKKLITSFAVALLIASIITSCGTTQSEGSSANVNTSQAAPAESSSDESSTMFEPSTHSADTEPLADSESSDEASAANDSISAKDASSEELEADQDSATVESSVEDESSSTNDSAFQIVPATANNEENGAPKELSFEEANIMSFELTNRDNDSYKEIISQFTCTNNGDTPIDYYSVDFVYKDTDGNTISKDGRYHDCQIAPSKSAYMYSYSNLDDGYDKNSIASIEVTAYDYRIGDVRYDIDLENQTVKTRKNTVDADAPFDEINIISFDYQDVGINSIGSYEVDVQANNNGDKNVTYISFRMAYFDSDGNYLDSDGRYNDNNVTPGTFVQMKSFMTRDELSYNVGAFGIFSYRYRLAEDDEYGFNSYEVNLQTKEISGQHRDS